MTGEVLIVTEMACAVPKKHPLARKRSLGPADLEDCASSGGAAAMKALAFLRRKPVTVA